jgi:hypothetical protein
MPNDLQFLKKALSTALANHARVVGEVDIRRATGNEDSADRWQSQHVLPVEQQIAELRARIAALEGGNDAA